MRFPFTKAMCAAVAVVAYAQGRDLPAAALLTLVFLYEVFADVAARKREAQDRMLGKRVTP